MRRCPSIKTFLSEFNFKPKIKLDKEGLCTIYTPKKQLKRTVSIQAI